MSRILETILPESVRNEVMLFVPQVLEDLMRGKLDREFPVRLDEGEDPASARTYAFDVARCLYKTFFESLTQANYKVVTRKFVVNLLDNALGWSFDRGESLKCTGEPFTFDLERRAVLRAELDARYAKLYGLNEQELTYILNPSAVYGPDYPSESFRVLKEKEIAEFGEYRTMRMVLEAFRKDER